MGTSKGYNMPTGGDWTPLKREATKFVKTGGDGSGNGDNDGDGRKPNPQPVSPESLLRNYLRAMGGANSIARGAGGGGGSGGSPSGGGGNNRRGGGRGGGGGGTGRAARNTGRNLGGFLSSVGSVGLTEALREVGLSHLVDRPASEVSAGLLDALAAPASTLDEHAARVALGKINDELLGDARTYADVESALTGVLDVQGLVQIIANFFGEYLYQLFCRDFYEGWMKKVGSSQAGRALKSVKDCIASALKSKLVNRDVARVDWRGREGARITQQVMRETLEIFEVTG
jgi:hypothetical protein